MDSGGWVRREAGVSMGNGVGSVVMDGSAEVVPVNKCWGCQYLPRPEDRHG